MNRSVRNCLQPYLHFWGYWNIDENHFQLIRFFAIFFFSKTNPNEPIELQENEYLKINKENNKITIRMVIKFKIEPYYGIVNRWRLQEIHPRSNCITTPVELVNELMLLRNQIYRKRNSTGHGVFWSTKYKRDKGNQIIGMPFET